jgi:light-regulated signal transduction histidine kinase (bacteriophytochrome)
LGTFIDITDLKDYSRRLEESNQELEQFAFIASHDLREPLRKIRSFGSIIMNRFESELPPQGKDYMARMTNAAERMDTLVQDLLVYSRVTSQAREFDAIDLNEVVQMVLSDLEPHIREKEARVTAVELPHIEGDNNQLYQLFQNLVGNALKYSKPGQPPLIEIRGEIMAEHQTCRIVIADNGVGFPSDSSDEIFKLFRRLHAKKDYQGSGIGLAICKKIIERHNGSILAHGVPGEGATFTITLPLGAKRDNLKSD